MLAGTIRKLLHEVPFVPFVIKMNDGRKFVIEHPDFAGVSPKGSTVTIYDEDDSMLGLSSLLIASVRQQAPADSEV